MSALAISPVSVELNASGTQQFLATGGTGPYVFSLVSGIGSITTGGLYTAPVNAGFAIVQVTDSAVTPATAQATIQIDNALTHFCDVIRTEMNLDQDQVYLWDQKIKPPTDQRLYIAVGIVSCKPFGNARDLDGSGSGLNEILSVNMQATLSVDIFSRSTDARDRKEEVILALRSIYAEQVQEANSLFISTLSSSFVNLSEIDGAAIPYRFNISVNIQYEVSKTKAVDYYDTFTDTEITDP